MRALLIRRLRPDVAVRMRLTKDFGGGLLLIAIAAIALWSLSGLSQGTMRVVGPAMFPRWVAIAIGIYGIVMVLTSFLREGLSCERLTLRGIVFVTLGILAFAASIRVLGFFIAAPVLGFLSGFAHPHMKIRESLILSIALAIACALLFRFLLGLPIPMLVLPGVSINF